MVRNLVAVAVLALAGLAMGGPARAAKNPLPPRDLSLGYRVYYGGFEVVRLDVEALLAPARYTMEMNFGTLGMLGRLFPWSMKAYSRGRLQGDDVRPLAAGQRNSWRGRQRWIDLRYQAGDPVVADARPPAGDTSRVEDVRGTIDLASAILALGQRMESGRPCSGRFPVFDGRRRYDIVLRRVGTERLRRSGYSAFEGPAVSCRAEMDRRAGFRRPGSFGGWGRGDRAAQVWMGRPFKDVPPVPVRLEIETRWGAVLAHLTRAEVRVAGIKRELAKVP